MRDFDELFFFAGASDSAIAEFADEAKTRGYTLQNIGSFWSFSVGADYAKCIRELGALYDRALRYHAFRVGVAVTPTADTTHAVNSDLRLKSLTAACDRTLFLAEGRATTQSEMSGADEEDQEEVDKASEEFDETDQNLRGSDDANDEDASPSGEIATSQRLSPEHHSANTFQLQWPDVWENALAAILARR